MHYKSFFYEIIDIPTRQFVKLISRCSVRVALFQLTFLSLHMFYITLGMSNHGGPP